MRSPSRLEALEASLQIVERSRHARISYEAKSLLPTAFGNLHEPLPKHNCYLSYNRCPWSGCYSWLSFITVVIQASLLPDIKLYENLTYFIVFAAVIACIFTIWVWLKTEILTKEQQTQKEDLGETMSL